MIGLHPDNTGKGILGLFILGEGKVTCPPPEINTRLIVYVFKGIIESIDGIPVSFLFYSNIGNVFITVGDIVL